MTWLQENVSWIFSGVGVFVVAGGVAFFMRRRGKVEMDGRPGLRARGVKSGGSIRASSWGSGPVDVSRLSAKQDIELTASGHTDDPDGLGRRTSSFGRGH